MNTVYVEEFAKSRYVSFMTCNLKSDGHLMI